MTQKLEYTVLDLIETAARNSKVQPLNLGGIAGAGGGVGGPAAGYIGWLPQTRVAYDETELASSGIPASGMSLLDNLNHIRYRLDTLSSGILIVDDWDGNPTINNVLELTFSGAIVTQLSPGHALVVISGGGIVGSGLDTTAGDARYLKLDASNDPITGTLRIDATDTTADGYGLRIYVDDATNFGNGLRVESLHGRGAYIKGQNEKALWLKQAFGDNFADTEPAIFLQRQESDLTTNVFEGAAFYIEDSSPAIFSGGGTLKHVLDSNTIAELNPYIDVNGIVVLADAQNNITASGRLISLKKQNVEIFSVDGVGNVNIPSGMFYNINGIPHTHSGGGGGTWGSITGTLSDQTDLQNALDAKAATNGWTAGTGTWSYSSADSPTFVISVNNDQTGLIGVGDRIKLTQTTVKYFIVTAVGNYSGGATLITVYGGTDYTLANAAISSPSYSHVKIPFGFPPSPAKWTVEVSDTTRRSYQPPAPTTETWYNLGSISISIPIGCWDVSYTASAGATNNPPSACLTQVTLSTANNSESDVDLTSYGQYNSVYQGFGPVAKDKVLTLASKTSYYFNTRATGAAAADLVNMNDVHKLFIRARCAYL